MESKPDAMHLEINGLDLVKLANFDALELVIGKYEDGSFAIDSTDFEDLAKVIGDQHRELFVKHLIERYENSISDYASVIRQVKD